jgi:hypothetical protein
MFYQEVVLPAQGKIGHAETSLQRPLFQQHQALLEGIRHLLPLLEQEATGYVSSSELLQTIVACCTTFTGVPDRLFGHSPLCELEQLTERVNDEAVFTFLLCSVFCEALRQSYGLSLDQETFTLCIPEIGAYTWFVPSHSLRTRLNSLLISCALFPIPIYLAGRFGSAQFQVYKFYVRSLQWNYPSIGLGIAASSLTLRSASTTRRNCRSQTCSTCGRCITP